MTIRSVLPLPFLLLALASPASVAAASDWPERPMALRQLGPDFTLVNLPAVEERALLGRLETLARHGLSHAARAAIAEGRVERITVWDANETRVRGRIAAIAFRPVPVSDSLRLRPVLSCGARDDAGDWNLCIDRTTLEYWRPGLPHPIRVPRGSDEAAVARVLERIAAGDARSRSGVPVDLRMVAEVAPHSAIDASQPTQLRVRVQDALGARWDTAWLEVDPDPPALDADADASASSVTTTSVPLEGDALVRFLEQARPLLGELDGVAEQGFADPDAAIHADVVTVQEVLPQGIATVEHSVAFVWFAPVPAEDGGVFRLTLKCDVDAVAVAPFSCEVHRQHLGNGAGGSMDEMVSPAQQARIASLLDGYRPDPQRPPFTADDIEGMLVLPEQDALAEGDGYGWVRVSLRPSLQMLRTDPPHLANVSLSLRPVTPTDPDSDFELAHHLCAHMNPCSIQHAE